MSLQNLYLVKHSFHYWVMSLIYNSEDIAETNLLTYIVHQVLGVVDGRGVANIKYFEEHTIL